MGYQRRGHYFTWLQPQRVRKTSPSTEQAHCLPLLWLVLFLLQAMPWLFGGNEERVLSALPLRVPCSRKLGGSTHMKLLAVMYGYVRALTKGCFQATIPWPVQLNTKAPIPPVACSHACEASPQKAHLILNYFKGPTSSTLCKVFPLLS